MQCRDHIVPGLPGSPQEEFPPDVEPRLPMDDPEQNF